MTQTLHNSDKIGSSVWRLGSTVGLFLAVALFAAGPAFAAYEQVGIFSGSLTPPIKPGVFPEEVQLGGVSGMAVNVDGAGGVAPGTVYADLQLPELEARISRFEPEPGGSLTFVEAWEITHKEQPYERCGPALASSCPPQAEHGISGRVDVAVDQTTGNVYAYSESSLPGSLQVTEYNADGSKVIARFGEKAPEGETTAASPEKIHAPGPGGIAVDNAGDVYVSDRSPSGGSEYLRLMEFVPQAPGDYEHYVYSGQSHDVGGGFAGEVGPTSQPALDSAGDIFVAGERTVEEYAPGAGGVFGVVCSFHDSRGGITAMTIDPDTNEVFYYDYKSKKVHRLHACNGQGEFVEAEAVGVTPERDVLRALAFDPAHSFGVGRQPGVLYGGTPQSVPVVGKGEPGQSSLGYIFAPVQENPPVVVSEAVSGVTSSSGELHAAIDPKGRATHYVFQFLTDAAFKEAGEAFTGAVEAPAGGGGVGNSPGAHSVSVPVSGLAADTAYRFRVLATSNCSVSEPEKVCETVGAVQGFHTFPVEASGLVDGRVYELVSPIGKNGGQVFPSEPGRSSCVLRECEPGGAYTRFPRQSTPDGEAVVYEGSAFTAGGGAIIENEYLARRSATGWQTSNLTPPSLVSKGHGGYEAFDPALTQALLEQRTPALTPGAPAGYPDYYLQPTGAPTAFTALMTDTPLNHSPFNRVPGPGLGSLDVRYAGASSDLSRVFFSANDALTAEATGGPEELRNLYEWAGGELHAVNILPGGSETTPGAMFGWKSTNTPIPAHAVSDDGSRVFWSSVSGQLYVREQGERTVEIPDHAGTFVTAAADGSRVLLSDGHLFSVGGEEPPVDLTQGKPGFDGLVGQSEDLSHVYFVDTEVLSETANDQGAKAQAGKDNLYYWHQGTTVFIAALLPPAAKAGAVDDTPDWRALPARTAEASPDGEWVAFLSHAPLTGYANIGKCEPIGETGELLDAPCPEVFLYNAAAGKLSCASCDPSGAAPLGRSDLTLMKGDSGVIHQPRYLIDTGRLYFDSQDSLTPKDKNGLEDVYQYEPAGAGTCTHNGGCVSLISSGTGTADSNFQMIDASGKNVFFTTRNPLLPADHDELVDLYDAREGGGIIAPAEQSPPACSGEYCQGPSPVPGSEPGPGSLAFTGAGNLIEPKSGLVAGKPKARTLTRAQVLARALKACKSKPKKKRAACERTARKKYATKASAKRATSNRKAGR